MMNIIVQDVSKIQQQILWYWQNTLLVLVNWINVFFEDDFQISIFFDLDYQSSTG